MKKEYKVVIVGGGQAGLSVSYCLQQRGIENVIIEKNTVAHSWKTMRWDTFCLVTPNWQCQLPDFPYKGNDPDGFMVKDEIVEYIEAYRDFVNPEIYEGTSVEKVKSLENGSYSVITSHGTITCDHVVVATGPFQVPKIPDVAKKVSNKIVQLHSSQYKNPESLPEGEIMVVGTGQSGCQIAEDLHIAGRKVHLCVGDAPRTARRYRGKDVVEWLDQMGHYDLTVYDHPDGENVRKKTNHYVTGRGGGHEIDLRDFAVEGMKLYGPFADADTNQIYLKPRLKEFLDKADASSERIKRKIDDYIRENNISAPTEKPYEPSWIPKEETEILNYHERNITSIIWCIGFGFHWNEWIEADIFNEHGYPQYERGISPQEGLYFIGLGWMYTWGSGRFSGIARDAKYIAEVIYDRALVSK